MAAAEELILPLLQRKPEAEAFLKNRAGNRTPEYPLRPLIAAALYNLDRWEEIPPLYGPAPEQGAENPAGRSGGAGSPRETGPLRGPMDSWDRAIFLMAGLRAAGAVGTAEAAGAAVGGSPAAGGSPGKPPEAAMNEAAEALFSYLFEAPSGPPLNWIAGELRRHRPGILNEAQDSALGGRLATAQSSFQRGLALFRPALEKESQLFSQYSALIDDLGRCFQFAGSDNEGIELFLEWRQAPNSTAAPDSAHSYRLLYYAGRIARARGLYKQGNEVFKTALSLAPDKRQEDACIWYILDTGLRDETEELSGPELLDLVKTWMPRWNNPPYFSDILDRIAQRLAASGQWERFPEFLSLLEQGGDPLSTARYAYISGRALAEGLIPQGKGVEPEEGARRFLRAAYNTGAGALYYRAMSAYFLGEPFLFPEEEGRNKKDRDGERPSHRMELDFLRGFFEEGVPNAAEPYVEALAGELGVEELRVLAEVMEKAGAYSQQIKLVSSYLVRGDHSPGRRDLELLSPRPFRELIETRAREAGLAPELFYGLIRTESAFQPEIVSRAGAMGLTQLMPATAADMAGRIKRRGGSDYMENLDLGDPEINTAIGAYYLNYLQGLLDHPLLAILAYNGGLSRVRRWRSSQSALPGDLFLETVEYRETREYGRRVISAAALYGYLYYGVNPPPFLADICK